MDINGEYKLTKCTIDAIKKKTKLMDNIYYYHLDKINNNTDKITEDIHNAMVRGETQIFFYNNSYLSMKEYKIIFEQQYDTNYVESLLELLKSQFNAFKVYRKCYFDEYNKQIYSIIISWKNKDKNTNNNCIIS